MSPASQGMRRSASSRNRVGLARLHMGLGVVGLLVERNWSSSASPRREPGSSFYLRFRALDSGLRRNDEIAASHRIALRSAAAEAMGASTRLARLSAQRIKNGGQGEAGPTLAAETQATPKISTGT